MWQKGAGPLISKKDWIELLNCSGGHRSRTQKATNPSEESMRNHPAWIITCKFKDFRATWRHVFLHIFYLSFIFLLSITNWVLPIWRRWLLKQYVARSSLRLRSVSRAQFANIGAISLFCCCVYVAAIYAWRSEETIYVFHLFPPTNRPHNL